MSSETNKMPPLRVLSLDGGGMRGVYSVNYLQRLLENFGRQTGEKIDDLGREFDLIVGTSTGAIIACALATGTPLSHVDSLYRLHGPLVFQNPVPSSLIKVPLDLIARPKAIEAGAISLRNALEETLGQETLGGVYAKRGIALAIPAVEMSRHRGWIFKTPHCPGSTHRDDGYTLVDVCMATSAAPIFRSLAAINVPENNDAERYHIFADGGLWANNPVMVALVDALDIAQEGQEIQIFCLGTCAAQAGEQIPKDRVHRGLGGWKFGGDAASLSLDAQQDAFDFMAKAITRHLKNPCRVVRFPSQAVAGAMHEHLALDNASAEAMQVLTTQALSDADHTNGACRRNPSEDTRLIESLFSSPRSSQGFHRV